MSYILDALRRAEAERSRGAVPGLHAQSLPADGEPAARGLAPLVWAGVGAGALVALGVLVLMFGPWRSNAPALPSPPSAQSQPPGPAQGALPPPQPGALDPAARPVEPTMDRANPASGDVPPPVRQQGPRESLVERAAAGRVATLQPRAQAPVEHYGAPIEAPSSPRANAVSKIDDLPPGVRSQLPRLTVGGAIYSDTPSARMVILNGQVFHEGDKPAPGTVLEQIRLKSAVLNFRGQRYEVSF